jgi:hypothetical protein
MDGPILPPRSRAATYSSRDRRKRTGSGDILRRLLRHCAGMTARTLVDSDEQPTYPTRVAVRRPTTGETGTATGHGWGFADRRRRLRHL